MLLQTEHGACKQDGYPWSVNVIGLTMSLQNNNNILFNGHRGSLLPGAGIRSPDRPGES